MDMTEYQMREYIKYVKRKLLIANIFFCKDENLEELVIDKSNFSKWLNGLGRDLTKQQLQHVKNKILYLQRHVIGI